MSLLEQGICLEEAINLFNYGGQVAGALRYGRGHINDTFAVYTQQPDGSSCRYILQRINTHVFRQPMQVIENTVGVTNHLRKKCEAAGGNPDEMVLTIVPARDGLPYAVTSDGGFWRSYIFVEGGVSYDRAVSKEMFAEAARAFGAFTRFLEDYPADTLHETIPSFHDTRERFAQFERALEEDKLGRARFCEAEIAFVQAHSPEYGALMDRLDAGELPLRVTHNDTKLNNILISPQTGKAVCVVDLDTVMPGLSLHDYGDAIRSGANTALEDEKDLNEVVFSLPLFEAYTQGYLQAAGASMTQLEIELLPWGARLMTMELGMRSLTDYLEGDVYFRSRREGQNLDRCRAQFRLVQDMERHWQQMQDIVWRSAERI